MLRQFTLAVAVLSSPLSAAGQVWTVDHVRISPVDASRQSRPPGLQFDEAPALERAVDPYAGRPVFRPLAEGVYGFRPKLGGILPGSSFALGPEFIKRDLAGGGIARASARASFREYYLVDGELALPRLANGHVFVNVLGVYRDLPRMPYYGQGPESSQDARTNFHLKDTNYELTAGIRPLRHLRLGATGGYLQTEVGPGKDSPAAPLSALAQPGGDFATAGGFAHFDYTDVPGSPRSGGDYSFRFLNLHHRGTGTASHRRFEVLAQQFVPFFSKQRIIALRGYSALTDARTGRAVPFYLQPSLGGPDMLRGYAPFRFYDNNLVLLNAEYRWKVSSGMEMAFFTDRGKVFPRVSDFHWGGMKSSYGVGMRLNARQNVFLRLDFACGGEGCELWLRFKNAY